MQNSFPRFIKNIDMLNGLHTKGLYVNLSGWRHNAFLTLHLLQILNGINIANKSPCMS